METKTCPNCECALKDITITEGLPPEIMSQYESGQWGVYECPKCGWNDVLLS